MDDPVTAAMQVIDALGQVDEQGRPHGDQHVGAKAGGALAVLALQADQAAQHEGEQQAGQGVEQGEKIELLPHSHEGSPPGMPTSLLPRVV